MSPPLQPAEAARRLGASASVLLLDPTGALGAALCAHLAERPRLALGGADSRAVRAAAAEVVRVRALHGAADAPLVLEASPDPVRAASDALGGLDALVRMLGEPPGGSLLAALAALPEGARTVLIAANCPPGLGEALSAFVAAHAESDPRRSIYGVVAVHTPRLGWAAPEGAEAYARAARAAAGLLDEDTPSGRVLRVPVRAMPRHVT